MSGDLIQAGDGAISCTACGSLVSSGGGRAPGPLRVYVAGGAAERGECAVWIARLREAGVCVTHDWTEEGVWRAAERTPAESATADLDGVRRCDVLWLLCPAAKSEGSACELGAALALGKRVVVSGGWDWLGRIFPGLAGVRCGTHEAGFAAVCGMVAL